jgi:hypothetical protein
LIPRILERSVLTVVLPHPDFPLIAILSSWPSGILYSLMETSWGFAEIKMEIPPESTEENPEV